MKVAVSLPPSKAIVLEAAATVRPCSRPEKLTRTFPLPWPRVGVAVGAG